MKPYVTHTSVVALLDRVNVDTDQIIAKQFLKSVERTGFGKHLFYDWRYHPDGSENVNFELNHPAFKGAKILLTGANFGCGSSREHAVWALVDYGFNTIIAPSFADIFYSNCFKNGLLPITIDDSQARVLITEVQQHRGTTFTIDLAQRTVVTAGGYVLQFAIDPFRQNNLLQGLDDIGVTLQNVQAIDAYEQKHRQQFPWLWRT